MMPRTKYPWATTGKKLGCCGMREAISRVWYLTPSEVATIYHKLPNTANYQNGTPDHSSFGHAVRLRVENNAAFKELCAILKLKPPQDRTPVIASKRKAVA
jgi:hypothetical protein